MDRIATGVTIGWEGFKNVEGYKYVVKLAETGSAVNIYDTSKSCAKAIFRIDRPHNWVNYDHLNISPKLAGLKADPHFWLPPGSADFCEKVGHGLKTVNEYIEPISNGLSAVELAAGVCADYSNGGGLSHTTGAVVRFAAGKIAGSCGAKAGAAVGTMICPGVGTVVGGFFSAVGASLGARHYATMAVDANYGEMAEMAQRYGGQAAQAVSGAASLVGETAINVGSAVLGSARNFFY